MSSIEQPGMGLATDSELGFGWIDALTWLGRGKRRVALTTAVTTLLATAAAFLIPPTYTARTTLLPPGGQQQGASAAALAALGSLGGLAGGLVTKTPDDLYVALLRSDGVVRALDERFSLQARYGAKNFESLRRALPKYVRISSDRKAGLIGLEVDDEVPAFAAELANAHVAEVTRVLGRLAVSEAQQRRQFFQAQLTETKEQLVRAEAELQLVQEKSGVIVLDKQAEALIAGAAQVRALIAEREVQLKVLRTGATERNPEVQRLNSELQGLRSELARLEGGARNSGNSALAMPVVRIPEAAVGYVRARREVKLQETLLEAMVRQYELARLDEAREGPLLQQIDQALPPDQKSKPRRSLIVLGGLAVGLLGASVWVIGRNYLALTRQSNPGALAPLRGLRQAWRLRA